MGLIHLALIVFSESALRTFCEGMADWGSEEDEAAYRASRRRAAKHHGNGGGARSKRATVPPQRSEAETAEFYRKLNRRNW